MSTVTQTSEIQDTGTQAESNADMIMLDIGKRSRKAIKRLRKGKGKLLQRVNNVVGQLRSSGELKEEAQIVLVVVRERDNLFG